MWNEYLFMVRCVTTHRAIPYCTTHGVTTQVHARNLAAGLLRNNANNISEQTTPNWYFGGFVKLTGHTPLTVRWVVDTGNTSLYT